jgi:flagella basal body P-ring formation protein FlgA
MVPVIHAGDLVRLWNSDSNVRLEMAVVSLEYGRLGQVIHVRRVGQTTLLAAVVVGKDSAELIQ